MKIVGDPEGCAYVDKKTVRPCIYSIWHSDEMTLAGAYAFYGVSVLVSLSNDGELIARTLHLLGFRTHRGSSSRGGAQGLLGLIRFVREGGQACIAVDGPRGPLRTVKPGIIEVAGKTGAPVVPARAFASRAWRFRNTWSRSYIPKPFATVTVVCSSPIFVEEDGPARSVRTDQLQRVRAGMDEASRIARSAGVAVVD